MADLTPAEPLDPEAEWLMLRVTGIKGKGKRAPRYIIHGIGRTEEEALSSVELPFGYALEETEVALRNITPEAYELFNQPMFDAIREERRKAAKRG